MISTTSAGEWGTRPLRLGFGSKGGKFIGWISPWFASFLVGLADPSARYHLPKFARPNNFIDVILSRVPSTWHVFSHLVLLSVATSWHLGFHVMDTIVTSWTPADALLIRAYMPVRSLRCVTHSDHTLTCTCLEREVIVRGQGAELDNMRC